MELLEGQTLRERLRNGAFELPPLLNIAKSLVDALKAAHRTGFVHRDIKPENIFLTNGGQTKILDFGLAKIQADAVSGSSVMLTIETITAHRTARYSSLR